MYCTKDYCENVYSKNLNFSSNFKYEKSEKILDGFKNIEMKFIVNNKYFKILRLLIGNGIKGEEKDAMLNKYKQIENLDKNKGDKILYFPIVFNFSNIGERDYSSIYVQVHKDNFQIINPWSNSIEIIRFNPKLTPQISFFKNRNYLFVKFTPPNYESDERRYCLYSISGNKVFEKKGHELDKFFFSENLSYCIYAKYNHIGKKEYILKLLKGKNEITLKEYFDVNSSGIFITDKGKFIIFSSENNCIEIFNSDGNMIDTISFGYDTKKMINFFDYHNNGWIFGNSINGFIFYDLINNSKRDIVLNEFSNSKIISVYLVKNVMVFNIIKNKKSHLILYDIENDKTTDILIKEKIINTKKIGNNLIIQNLNNIEVYEIL